MGAQDPELFGIRRVALGMNHQLPTEISQIGWYSCKTKPCSSQSHHSLVTLLLLVWIYGDNLLMLWTTTTRYPDIADVGLFTNMDTYPDSVPYLPRRLELR